MRNRAERIQQTEIILISYRMTQHNQDDQPFPTEKRERKEEGSIHMFNPVPAINRVWVHPTYRSLGVVDEQIQKETSNQSYNDPLI